MNKRLKSRSQGADLNGGMWVELAVLTHKVARLRSVTSSAVSGMNPLRSKMRPRFTVIATDLWFRAGGGSPTRL